MKPKTITDLRYEVRNYEKHSLVGSKTFTSRQEAEAFATYKTSKANPIQLQSGYFTSIYEYRNGIFYDVVIYAG